MSKNHIAESGVNITEIIVDDTSKVNNTEKRTKENQAGKLVVNNNKKKVFILVDNIVKYIQGW